MVRSCIVRFHFRVHVLLYAMSVEIVGASGILKVVLRSLKVSLGTEIMVGWVTDRT